MMRAAVIILAMLLPAVAWAEPGNLALLADRICYYETESVPERKKDSTPGADGEIGRCQIMLETARAAGYQGSEDALWLESTNRAVARMILLRCQGSGPFDPHRMAYCYHAGHKGTGLYPAAHDWEEQKAQGFRWGYANRVALAYSYRMARRQAVTLAAK